jgi:hypothetical protein
LFHSYLFYQFLEVVTSLLLKYCVCFTGLS